MLKFLIKSAIWSLEAALNTPVRKGARGERRVQSALSAVLDQTEYRVFPDLMLPLNGRTTQIDHLVLSRFGIFVIETKNMSGWIYGDPKEKSWMQIQKGGKRRRFLNPLRQNYAHLKAVENALELDRSLLHNIVVFVGSAEPKTDMPESVAWGLGDLGRLIGRQRKEVLSSAQVAKFEKMILECAVENSAESRRRHIDRIREKEIIKATPRVIRPVNFSRDVTCPKCSASMVKRKNRKSGASFWGCTDFPKCRGTREID